MQNNGAPETADPVDLGVGCAVFRPEDTSIPHANRILDVDAEAVTMLRL